ncbi:hypothetical protein [Neorhizobium sp. DAR64860/K0K1]|uniref:hypothetical protein n=1 Tax=Neorhizobium sp. DAR64860/K0K1 TaxID=3421955 RepID=UPI003D2B9420
MADYREISQVFAQEGIKAALLINSGAAVALLTQATTLIEKDLVNAVFWPLLAWVAGTSISTLLWIFAFISARLVDKSTVENRSEFIELSNRWMMIGVWGFVFAVGCFCVGAVTLAFKLA